MTNRSLETIVCMIAILKSGAAFLNIDPTYPIERTEYYISDSKIQHVLTQRELADKVAQIKNRIDIDLDIEDIYGKIKKILMLKLAKEIYLILFILLDLLEHLKV